MKRFVCLLLMLFLLSGCSEEANPSIRYENDAAYYEQEGAELSMELRFAGILEKGSEIKLLNGATEVLALTVENATQTLTLRSSALEKDVPYTLTVNGVMQQHGMQPLRPPSQVIDIPDQPTIPMEPMGEQPSESEAAGGFTPGAGAQLGIGAPPAGFGEGPAPDIEIIPPNGERPDREPPEDFGGKKPPKTELGAKFDHFTFTLTAETQSFAEVRDALKPEGKEPFA